VIATVVIPTWQRDAWLERCLNAVESQGCHPDQVIVVGRPDDEKALAIVDRFAHLPACWVEVDRPGHVAPVRRGLEAAVGEIVAFLDDDTEPNPVWLSMLLEPFSDPSVACVGGKVITHGFKGRVHRDAGRVRWYGKYVGNIGALEIDRPIEVDGVMEGNWAWRADVLRRMDFDPRFDFDDASMYGLDLCLQARERGWRVVYHPGARIVHHVAPRDPELDRADRPRRTYTYARNYTYLGLKHFHGFRRLLFFLWWSFIGERGAYGFATGATDLVRQRDGIWDLVRASLAGKWKGTRLWMSTRQGLSS